ncbi:transposase [Escherichia albertii]|nr:transposase [Escherichia albertii]
MQKNVTPGRRKGCPNYPPEFKQQLVAASCEPGISISKLALENGINANLLFKWRQQWREGKLLLPSSESCMNTIICPVWPIIFKQHFRIF